MKGFFLVLAVFVLWIALNRWILPWFGIRTCMSGSCSTEQACLLWGYCCSRRRHKTLTKRKEAPNDNRARTATDCGDCGVSERASVLAAQPLLERADGVCRPESVSVGFH